MSKRLLRRPEVEQRTGLKCSAIYERMAAGTFPKAVKLSAGAVAWPECEIDDWIEARIAERDTATAA